MSNTPRGRDSNRSDTELIRETHSRVRRLETRMTSMMIAQGMDTPAQRPQFTPAADGEFAHVKVPSPHCSIKDIVDSIPKTCHGTVGIVVGSDCVATIEVPGGRRPE